jgi:hypothetical protein
MRLDELREPLRRRSYAARLWSKRPSLLVLAYALAIIGFSATAIWTMRQPYPFAGEPVIVAQIPPVEEVTTASTTPAEGEGDNVTEVAQTQSADDEPQFATEAAVEELPEDQTARKKVKITIEEPVEQSIYKQEAGIVVSPRHQPLVCRKFRPSAIFRAFHRAARNHRTFTQDRHRSM